MQPRAPVSFLSFLGPEGFPLIAPRICIIIGPVRSLAQTDCADKNTFLSLWECPKMGFFPLYFCTKGIFFGWSQRD